MKKISKKWWAILALAICVMTLTVRFSNIALTYINQALEVVERDAHEFLPITIKDGEIISPKDTLITKTYQNEIETFNVSLDTRVDELNISSLTSPGLYASKKCIYAVTSKEKGIKSSCFDKSVNDEFTEEKLKDVLPTIKSYITGFIYGYIFILTLLWCLLSTLIYTVLMHWIMALSFKTKFTQTWFINILAYATMTLIPYDFGLIITYIIMLASNAVVAIVQTKKK